MADARDRARVVLFLSATMSASVVSVRLRGHGRISLKRKLPSARSDGLPPDASSASAFGCVYERRLTLHPEARERPWLVIGGPALRMHTQPHAAPSGLGVTGTPLNLTVRWPGPTWRTQVIDDDAALEAAIGSMERPLVVVEPA